MDFKKELELLSSELIFVSTVFESIGSDEWVFAYTIDYLPKVDWDLKRRMTSFKRVSSFGFTGGATYYGGYDTITEALEEGIKYAKEKILLK